MSSQDQRTQNEHSIILEVITVEAHLAVCASTPMAPSHLGNHARGVNSEGSLADVFPIEVALRYSEFL